MTEKMRTMWPKAMKKTPERLRVAQLLEESGVPMNAAEIAAQLQGDAAVNRSTVYRILDAFAANGLAEKMHITEDGPAYYVARTGVHRHYAICLGCRQMIPLAHCPIDCRSLNLTAAGFEMTGHRLEVYGYCRTCAKNKVQN